MMPVALFDARLIRRVKLRSAVKSSLLTETLEAKQESWVSQIS